EGSFLNFGIRVLISEFSNDYVFYVRVYIVICDKIYGVKSSREPTSMDGMTDDLVDIIRKQFAMY
ncbi:unnamed protein product, partial [Brassica rapa subsp. narinosa]